MPYRRKIVVALIVCAAIMGTALTGWHFRHRMGMASGFWFDVILGTLLLAVVPFWLAAYGGHVAAESITDSKRQSRVKLKFWIIFVFGLLVAFVYQFRAVMTDQERDIHATWTEALLLAQFRVVPLPPFWDVKTIPVVAIAKPDLSIRLAYPEDFALIINNDSNVIARDVLYWFGLWDLDRRDDTHDFCCTVLPIPSAKAEWIRAKESVGPLGVLSLSQVSPLLKKGDRIFGFIGVSCAACVANRFYWVYTKVGEGGWYSKIPDRQGPQLDQFRKALPMIQANPETQLSFIPESQRMAIGPLNPKQP